MKLQNPNSWEIDARLCLENYLEKNGSAYLLSLLGLDSTKENSESLAKGLKELRMGDILELFLDEKLERKILNEDYVKNNKDQENGKS